MKTAITVAALFVATFFTYCIGAYTSLEPNIFEWEIASRVLHVWSSIVLWIMLLFPALTSK